MIVSKSNPLFASKKRTRFFGRFLSYHRILRAGVPGELFFDMNKKLENEEVVDSVSSELLEINPDHTGALEWEAMKYYWKAENRYQREMEKYNNNKTRSQYRILLDELDKVTADFKVALSYFEKLWEQNPGEKYAPYMANIYARFNDKEKADYYRKFVE